jgi:hypothetical protein
MSMLYTIDISCGKINFDHRDYRTLYFLTKNEVTLCESILCTYIGSQIQLGIFWTGVDLIVAGPGGRGAEPLLGDERTDFRGQLRLGLVRSNRFILFIL